jgi:hypothetical protein
MKSLEIVTRNKGVTWKMPGMTHNLKQTKQSRRSVSGRPEGRQSFFSVDANHQRTRRDPIDTMQLPGRFPRFLGSEWMTGFVHDSVCGPLAWFPRRISG